jgi:hypothetical protein
MLKYFCVVLCACVLRVANGGWTNGRSIAHMPLSLSLSLFELAHQFHSKMENNKIKSVVLLLFLVFDVSAFQPSTTSQIRAVKTLRMVPRYDPFTNRWEATSPAEAEGYGSFGSLIRQGPVPFFRRLLDEDKYDQGVLMMMAKESMPRDEAQGNMDAYLLNPNDWALQRYEEKNGSPKFDYANANMDSENLVLTSIWASILLVIAVRIAFVAAFGCDSFCQATHF